MSEGIQELTKNQCIGVSRGGLSTKIHAVVDGLGNPLKVMLTSGEVHDSQVAIPLLEQIDLEGTIVLGDKGYSAKKIRGIYSVVYRKPKFLSIISSEEGKR